MAQTTITHLSAETDAEMLRNAAKLVQGGWTTDSLARNASGERVRFHKPEAVCFCTLGAIQRAVMDGLGGDPELEYTILYDDIVLRLQGFAASALSDDSRHWRSIDGVAHWNDTVADQKAAVALLENAATLAASSTTA